MLAIVSAGRRVRQFAAPLVIVVAASPGCKKPTGGAPPRVAIDAGVAAAADRLMYFDSASGGCMTYPDHRPADCSGQLTLIVSWKTVTGPDGPITFDAGTMSCGSVACPPELLPSLTGGVKMTRQEGDACYWNDVRILCPGHIVFDDPACYQADATGQRAWVECPPDLLPPAPKDELVYAQGTSCFPVHASGGQGRVTCPTGGPTVVLPATTSKDLGGGAHVGFNSWSMACQQWQDMSCPQGASCNPPPPMPVECPPDLLPQLANGEKPTSTKDGKCYWQTYQVACQ
jgi:hypothetical protein